jgi:hypothetical protein
MEQIFSNIASYGLTPWMILSLLLILGIVWILKDSLGDLVKKLFDKNQTPAVRKISDLKNHDIFNTCERIKHEIKFTKFYTHGTFDAVKTKMCVDFTTFKANVCSKRFKEFLDVNLDTLSYDELKSEILREMGDIHIDYINATRTHWLSKGILPADVDYIIEIFEKFRYDVVVSFQHRVDSIFASSYHRTRFDKLLACYDMFAMGLDLLPRDMQTTFEALNGKFKEIPYI